ncbi:MAG: GIY-YIG nuclease family protein [Patescibacteria group bacterium]
MHYVYILQSFKINKLYIGSTADLRNRIIEHNLGQTKSTKFGRPWKLIYYEAHLNKTLALKAEIFYKTGQGRRQIKKKLGLN